MSEKQEQEPQVEGVVAEEGATEASPEETLSYEEAVSQLEAVSTKADESWNELLRARAEMENQRRRAERELESAHKYALEKFSNELLAVVDSLEMGVDAAGNENATVETLREGSEMTLKMLLQTMQKFGVETINPEGEKFDAEWHQAMTMQETDDVEPNTVVAVFQKGYSLNGRLIRPARVVVSKATADAAGSSETKIDEQA